MEPVFNPDAAKPTEESELFEPQSPSDEPPIYRQLSAEKNDIDGADCCDDDDGNNDFQRKHGPLYSA